MLAGLAWAGWLKPSLMQTEKSINARFVPGWYRQAFVPHLINSVFTTTLCTLQQSDHGFYFMKDRMYLTRFLVAAGLLATSALSCTPGQWGCGRQNGVPGPEGAVYVCNALGSWVYSTQCNGSACCWVSADQTNAGCRC